MMKRISLAFLALASMATLVVAGEKPTDAVAGVYEGFWKTANGNKGRVTAHIRSVGEGRYGGTLSLYRAKSCEGALQLTSSEKSPLKFKATAAKSEDGALTAKLEGSSEIVNGKLIGHFKGDLGEGTFDAVLTKQKSEALAANTR